MSEAIAAVVFDLDGVLIDSESVWDAARREVVARNGGRWQAGATPAMMGMSSPEWSPCDRRDRPRQQRQAAPVLIEQRGDHEFVDSRYLHDQLGVPLELERRLADRWHRAWQFNRRWVTAATLSNSRSAYSKPYARTVAQRSRGIGYVSNDAPHANRRMHPPPHDRLARTAARVPVLLGGSRSPRQTMS